MKNTFIIVLIVLVLGAIFVLKADKQEVVLVSDENEEAEMIVEGDKMSPEDAMVSEMAVDDTHDTDSSDESQVKEFTVSGKNFSFTPSTIVVQKGDKVKITFQNTGGFHDFVIDEFNVATKQANSPDTQIVEFVANQTGSFEYYCSVGTHRSLGMKGTLTVE